MHVCTLRGSHMLRQSIQKIKAKQAMHCALCGFLIHMLILSTQGRPKHAKEFSLNYDLANLANYLKF